MKYSGDNSARFRLSALAVLSAAVLALALLMQVLGAFTFFVDGVYAWHIKRPAVLEGGLELIVLAALLIASGRTRFYLAAWVILSLLYLQRHHVLVPVLAAGAYFEVILGTGLMIRRRLSGESPARPNLLIGFLAGLIAWSAVAITMSLVGIGSIVQLRVMTLLLAAVVLSDYRISDSFTARWLEGLRARSYSRRVLLSLISIIALMQAAKTNARPGSDELWYSLRPEKVLFGANSFYENLGMVHPVHYYPKFLEFFLSPLSGLQDYSFLRLGLTLFFCLTLLAVFRWCREMLSEQDEILPLCLALALATVPAISNTASMAKPDGASLFLFVATAYLLWRWSEHRDRASLFYGVSGIALAFSTKLTAVLYAPMLLLGFGVLTAWTRLRGRQHEKMPILHRRHFSRREIMFVVPCAALTFFGVLGRTWAITGVPILHGTLRSFWSGLGFHIKYPFFYQRNMLSTAEELLGDGLADALLSTLQKWIWLLTGYNVETGSSGVRGNDHWFYLWPSSLAALMAVALALALTQASARRRARPLFLVIFVAFAGVFFVTIHQKGGDGNYFIVPIVLFCVPSAGVVACSAARARSALIAGLLFYVPLQATISLVTHISWYAGTEDFRLVIAESFLDSAKWKVRLLQSANLLPLEAGIKELAEPDVRCVGLVRGVRPRALSCAYESLEALSRWHHGDMRWHNDERLPPLVSSNSAIDFFKWAKIRFVVMPAGRIPFSIQAVDAALDSLGGESLIRAKSTPRRKKKGRPGAKGLILYDLSLSNSNESKIHQPEGFIRDSQDVFISARPNPIQVCDGSRAASTKISWIVKDARQIEVRIGSPKGKIYARLPKSGSRTTGKWVHDGMVFYLQDATHGDTSAPEKTIGSVKVTFTTAGCLYGDD